VHSLQEKIDQSLGLGPWNEGAAVSLEGKMAEPDRSSDVRQRLSSRQPVNRVLETIYDGGGRNCVLLQHRRPEVSRNPAPDREHLTPAVGYTVTFETIDRPLQDCPHWGNGLRHP
jgi:hypothetical protein